MRIPIPEDCEKINVLLSGGADSALLLFLLMKERKLTSRNIPIKCYVMDSPNEAHKDVLKWVSQYFKEDFLQYYVGT